MQTSGEGAMPAVENYSCADCGKPIESPAPIHLWDERTLCGRCYRNRKSNRTAAVAQQSTAAPVAVLPYADLQTIRPPKRPSLAFRIGNYYRRPFRRRHVVTLIL